MWKIWCVGLLLPLGGSAADKPGWREDFSRTRVENKQLIPVDWIFGGFRFGVAKTSFYVIDDRESGRPVLVVDARSSTGALMCRPSDKKADLNKTPILRWRWRVKSLPPGGDGRKAKNDDQAIAIYVGGPGTLGKKCVAYRWESETPVGATGKVAYGLGSLTINWICVRNKESKLGVWYEETRDVAADYRKYYGKVPERFVISVCGNSQYSKSETIAEIEFLELTARQAAPSASRPQSGHETAVRREHDGL